MLTLLYNLKVTIAGVMELVDVKHSKCFVHRTCRFESDHRHQTNIIQTNHGSYSLSVTGSDYCFTSTMISSPTV